MSELKVYRFLGLDEVWPDANLGSDYYLKSEADKVIAHNKYKRCLAMAEVCKHKRWRADVCDEQGYDYARSTNQMNRWLELAEKFKEAK